MRTPGNKTLLLILGRPRCALASPVAAAAATRPKASTPTVEEPAALTKDELIAQGDGICAEVNAAVGALSGSESPESTPSESTEKVADLYVGMVERLQDLGAPEDTKPTTRNSSKPPKSWPRSRAKRSSPPNAKTSPRSKKRAGSRRGAGKFQSQAAIYGFEECSEEPGLPTPAGGEATPGGEEFEGGEAEEGGVEPEYVEPEYEEPAPEEEVAPETGGAGGSPEAPEPAPETGGESGGVGPG